MTTIDETNPNISKDFDVGRFVMTRKSDPFSSIWTDQYHEELNKIVKGDDCTVGLTEDNDKLRRWTVYKAEVALLENIQIPQSEIFIQKNSATMNRPRSSIRVSKNTKKASFTSLKN